MTRHPFRRAAAALSVLFALSGCASDFTRQPAPEIGWRNAVSAVAPEARFWGDIPPSDLPELGRAFTDQVIGRLDNAASEGRPDRFTVLALSGGAEDGAFGAGVLVGWTESGARPEFDVVTGVSTGALIAPFAFLGPEYDEPLRMLFTETSTDDLIELAIFDALTGGLGLVDTSPLQRAIADVVTLEFLAAVAAEHRRGRRLFVATTNLDARRSVMWDMGAIALRGDPAALALFRKVMLASTSIPGAFPPVYMDVVIDGAPYKEMHVDGGVVASVFIAPSWVPLDGMLREVLTGRTTIYVIQNNKIDPQYGPTPDRLVDITATSISELIRTQGRGDQLRIYTVAQRSGFDYQVAYVPTDFDVEAKEPFDPVYMSALFARGRALGFSGEVWEDTPPTLPRALTGYGVAEFVGGAAR